MFCHAEACGALRFVMRCHVRHAFPGVCRSLPAYRSVLLRSVRPAGRPGGRDPLIARICVRARAGVGAGAVRAPDCPREAEGAHLPLVPGRRCEMSCDVMFAMPSPMLCGSVCAYRSSTAFRPPPFRPPAAGPAGGTLFRAYRGRVSAPARFAHLIARARQRAHLSCGLLRGFQKAALPGRAAPGKRLRSPLPWGPSYHNPPDVKPISGTKFRNIGNCSRCATAEGPAPASIYGAKGPFPLYTAAP